MEQYISKAFSDGDSVEAALLRAMSGGAIDAAIQQKPNPTLIDNGVFLPGCLVDQRQGYVVPPGSPYYIMNTNTQAGTTDRYYKADKINHNGAPYITVDGVQYYATAGNYVRGYTGAGMTVDRWKLEYGTILIEEDCIFIVGPAGFSQVLEQPKNYVGVDLTFSVLGKNGEFGSVTNVIPSLNSDMTIGIIYIDGTEIVVNWQNGAIRLFVNGEGARFKAAKLELGDTKTLAHQDADGNWQLNELPNYADTLARCQRSLIDLNPNAIDYFLAALGTGWSGGTEVDFTIPVPVTMRDNPSIVDLPNFQVVDTVDGTWHSFTSANCYAGSGVIKLVGFIDASVQGRTYALMCNNVRKKMLLSAEIL